MDREEEREMLTAGDNCCKNILECKKNLKKTYQKQRNPTKFGLVLYTVVTWANWIFHSSNLHKNIFDSTEK